MIRRTLQRPPGRRGAILLVVLAMLALFAVIGLSFVLYAQSEATGAKNNSDARNELADPDPSLVANQFLGQFLFEPITPNSPLAGHSLARSRFGPAGMQSPYTGTQFPPGAAIPLPNGASLDQTRVVNYGASAGAVNPDSWNKAVPWTYPDRNNFYLAYFDPITNQVTVPSFHRPDLFGPLDPTNPNWTNPDGFWLTLRPRPLEHPNFAAVPPNADGTSTGDVANLKFLTGSTTQHNDSLWMDVGFPIKTWQGRRYKGLVAPLVLDMGGRVNLSVAGNNRGIGGAHGSHHGWGPWEVNPAATLGGGPADVARLLDLRHTGTTPAGALTPLDPFRNLSTGSLNHGQMPPQTSRIDASGSGPGGPMTLPAAGGFSPFPTYSNRFALDQAGLNLQLGPTHGQSFSTYQWPHQATPVANTPWVPSLEDQLRLALPIHGPRGPRGYGNAFNPNPNLATLFGVSQRWGEVTVPTAAGTPAKLVAIDVARPLPDYRTNVSGPLSPQNVLNLVPARVARQNLARDIFVRLAAAANLVDGTNVSYNPISAYLNIGAGTPPPAFASLRVWAQYAANLVDQIDNDDVSTSFIWNPADPTQSDVNADLNNFTAATIANRVVYGTELPKLVLNEAYCMLNNSRQDTDDAPNTGPPPVGIPPTRPNRDNLLKRYWLELHNPLPTNDPTLPDGGAARLRYVPATTPVFDAASGAVAPYTGPLYAAYQIEIGEVPPAAMGLPQPYSAFLATTPLGEVANAVVTPVPGMTHKIVLNDYTPYNPQPMGGAVMGPTDATNAVAGQQYFVIGPQDLFPSAPQVANNLCVNDPPAMPMGPVNSLSYDTGTRRPVGNPMGTPNPTETTSVVLLRRLVNPYLPPQPDPALPGYNPYMTVDFLENVPTRDRARYDETNDRTIGGWTASAAATVGRRHPYAAAPVYNPAAMAAPFPAVVDQNPAMPPMPAPTTPPHTFGVPNNANNPAHLDNAAGLAWLAHLDREPVNQLELLHTSVLSPAQLTQRFYDGSIYQKHIGFAAGGTPALPPPLDSVNYASMARVFDLLQTGSRLPGVPLGGREPGKINLNTAAHPSALQAVLDPQTGNLFNAAYVTGVWPQLLASRTVNPGTPAATVGEGGTDRPFQPGGQLFLDTLFRQNTATPNYPALFNAAGGNHTYLQAEPLRKGWNNLTTVSDGFLVLFTVGFFEVDAAGRLGAELTNGPNGTFRAQYAAIVDRSAMTLNIAPTLAVQPNVLGPKPWETKLVADSLPGSNQITIQATVGGGTCVVYDNGQPVTIDATGAPPTANRTSQLWVGYSMANPTNPAYANPPYGAGTPQAADGGGEAVRVTAVAAGPTPGTAILTVQTVGGVLTHFHGASSRVSNAPVGHPGPQPGFDYRDDRYRGVLPFFMRMTPRQ